MNDRSKWTVFAVLLTVLGGGVAMVALAGGGSEDGRGRLTLERSTVPGSQQPELVVSVDPGVNVAATAENGRSVRLVCRDSQKRSVLSARVEWPFIDEPGYALPHAHQPASSREITRIQSCRLTGTKVVLQGRMSLRG